MFALCAVAACRRKRAEDAWYALQKAGVPAEQKDWSWSGWEGGQSGITTAAAAAAAGAAGQEEGKEAPRTPAPGAAPMRVAVLGGTVGSTAVHGFFVGRWAGFVCAGGHPGPSLRLALVASSAEPAMSNALMLTPACAMLTWLSAAGVTVLRC